MTRKLKAYDYEQARDLVRSAVAGAQKRHERWRMLELIYRTGSLHQAELESRPGKVGEFFPDLTDEVVNLVLPHLNIIMASVVARDPQLVAVPYGGGEEAESHRATVEGVINYFWERLSTTRELRDSTQDAVHLGAGFLKTGWIQSYAEEEARDTGDIFEDALAYADGERLMAELSGVDPEGDLESAVDHVPQTHAQLLQNEPFTEYVSPYDLFVPSDVRRLEDARWIAHRVSLPMDEVLANPAYDADEESLQRDGALSGSGQDQFVAESLRQAYEEEGAHSNSAAVDMVTLYEFYDMRTRRLMVFQIDGEGPIFEDDFPWGHRYPPFVHVRNYRQNGNDFWGFGDLENISTAQSIFNEMLSEQVGSARRAGNKSIIRQDLFSEGLKALLETSEGDAVGPVDLPQGEDLRSVVVPIERKPLPQEQLQLKHEMSDMIQQVLGINDFQAGGVGADRMSATAAAVVDGVATLRAQDKIHAVEVAASEVATRLVLLCQQFLEEPTAIRVSGVERANWIRVSKDDLAGEFLVKVEGGSTRAINPQTREAQGLRTLGEVLPALVQLGYDHKPALRSALRDLGYDPDVLLIPAEQEEPPPGDDGSGDGPVPPGAEQDPFAEQAEAEMSSGEQMMMMGGPPVPAEAQMMGGPLI